MWCNIRNTNSQAGITVNSQNKERNRIGLRWKASCWVHTARAVKDDDRNTDLCGTLKQIINNNRQSRWMSSSLLFQRRQITSDLFTFLPPPLPSLHLKMQNSIQMLDLRDVAQRFETTRVSESTWQMRWDEQLQTFFQPCLFVNFPDVLETWGEKKKKCVPCNLQGFPRLLRHSERSGFFFFPNRDKPWLFVCFTL